MIDPNEFNELARVANSDAGKALTLPAAHEIGQFFGDIANFVRFYTTENLGKVFTSWYGQRKSEGKQQPTLDDIKKVLPLLQSASMQGDVELQERWASLLNSASKDDPDYLPSFASTLSVLTAEQVKFLDRLWAFAVNQDDHTNSGHPPGMARFDEHKLIKVFDPSINGGVNAAEVKLFGARMSEEQHADYRRYLHCKMVIDNLIGLKILEMTQEVGLVGQQRGIDFTEVGTRQRYSFTHYGAAFIRSVAVPQQRANA
jgi:hypothetical protein